MFRLFTAIPVLIVVSQGVPLIDLTQAPVHRRLREPTTASISGGGIAYGGISQASPSPILKLTLLSAQENIDDQQVLVTYEVELRNVSKESLDIPVSPSSRDIEPEKPNTPYNYLNAYLWVTMEPPAKTNNVEYKLSLYGSPSIPSTLKHLSSGEAIRIRAKSATKMSVNGKSPTMTTRSLPIRAFFSLYKDFVTLQKDGHLHSDLRPLFQLISSSNTLKL